jgi:mitogen-activated protein kinase 15
MDYYPRDLLSYDPENSQLVSIERKIILFQLIKAVNHLHSHGIYHRDINPSNVLLNDRLEVVLTDFSSAQEKSLPYLRQFKCWRLFRPPEMILNPEYSYKAGGDMWCLGSLIAYMLTGSVPFDEGSDADLLLEIFKVTGRPSQTLRESIGYRPCSRFVFPKFSKFSIKRVRLPDSALQLQRS